MLLLSYGAQLVFSPRQDGEEGKGVINLYNFIFHGHKFGFASGKCYNIDMLKEGKVALINANNLMQKRVVSANQIMSALQADFGEIEMDFDSESIQDALLESHFQCKDENLANEYCLLRTQAKQIANKLKEKLNGN